MLWLLQLGLYLLVVAVLALAVMAALGRFVFAKAPTPKWLPDEKTFKDPSDGTENAFPTIHTPPTKTLSIIVPAYNEEERIGIMLDETLDYCRERTKKEKDFSYEIIVVDDGCKDATEDVVNKYILKETTDRIRYLKLNENKGKGGAVRRGMLYGRGKYLLMVDADGATKFSDLDRVEKALKDIERDGWGISVGSRAHLQEGAVAKRTFLRNILMYVFHIVAFAAGVGYIKDTQCGFKLFTRKAAAMLYPNMHIERFAFDVELLLMARKLNIPVAEVSVNWTEIDGSKLNPYTASFSMFFDILILIFAYHSGMWQVPNIKKVS